VDPASSADGVIFAAEKISHQQSHTCPADPLDLNQLRFGQPDDQLINER
jgi:hypothetical protein